MHDKGRLCRRSRSRRRQRIGVVNRSSDLVREPCEFTRTRAEVLAKLMCARKIRRAARREASLQQNIRVFVLPSTSWLSDLLPQQQQGFMYFIFSYRSKVRRRGIRADLGLVLLAASRQFVHQETISCGVDSFERMLKCYGGICITLTISSVVDYDGQ